MDNIENSEFAQTLKERKPPYPCPVCQKEYRSVTGILYHLGKTGPPSKVPRCVLGEETPQGSPKPPGSPGSSTIRRKGPRRDLTWAEAQRLVELEFDTCYKRLEIDHNLDVSLHSDEEGEESIDTGAGGDGRRGSMGAGPRTPQRRVKGGTKGSKGDSQSRGKWSSKSKNKGKRKSKLKTPGEKEGEGQSSLPKAEVTSLDCLEFTDAPNRESSYYRFVEQSAEDLDETIEYDMDEEDYQWLSLVNEERKSQGLTAVPQDVFEILMDRLEKECFFESHMVGPGMENNNMYNIDENAVCVICNDGECHNTNAILFCDMCNLAVHQECYGVPYIPEGQWLCRRCLQSPSRGVDCVLCPNKGGAFKQTVDSKWAHVICAIWIPEVQFANPVFLEPIDGINDIPPARWKLTCYICHKRMGACIQCSKTNCYVAFHVTCAQLAGLHMKVELVKGGEVRKTAYCDTHTPPSVKRKKERLAREKALAAAASQESDDKPATSEGNGEKENKSDNECDDSVAAGDCVKGEGGEESDGDGGGGDSSIRRDDSEEVAKAVQSPLGIRKHSSNQPIVNIPYVPQHRLDRIVTRVSLHKKSQFIPKLVSYWKLKRQSRNGVPLLRRLQASSKGQRSTANLTEEEREVLAEQLTHWKNLRHDLERARLLIELIRKREKMKKEHLKMLQSIQELQVKPLNLLIRRVLERLRRKDPAEIFAEPVSIDEVPDYLDVIKNPMDFTTMRKKLEANEYHTLSDFKKDFYLVWHNATVYNHKDTIYYRAALRIKEAGLKMIEEVSGLLDCAMVDPATGIHNPAVQEPPPLTPCTTAIRPLAEVLQDPTLFDDSGENDDKVFTSSSRSRRLSSTASLSLDEQVELLQEKLEMVPMQYSGFAKKSKEKKLKREIQALKRQLKLERKISESDEHGTPPPRRQRAASIPRNAEELACHVLHGSLRLTPSRQQILSHSGIRLEERATSLQDAEQQQQNSQALPHPLQTAHHTAGESNLLHSHVAAESANQSCIKSPRGGRGRITVSIEGANSNTDSDDENSSESSSSSSDEEREEEEEVGNRSSLSPQKRVRGRHKDNVMATTTAASSREQNKNSNRRPRPQFKSRKRPSSSTPAASTPRMQQSRSKRKPKPLSRTRLDSGGAYSSTSEAEFPVNGTSRSHHIGTGSGGVGVRDVERITREESKCSSVYETANEGYMSVEEKTMTSPFSDTPGGIPKATGIEELTARNLTVPKQQQTHVVVRGKKRKRSTGASDRGKKKSRLESGSSADGGGAVSKSKTINGLVNGSGVTGGVDIKPLDLVWAKCRGYPPYPALVIDPDIPPKGLNINGERIQAPSDEVMELREKNSNAIYLVRFFDGRRTWQWLPPDKIEPLGIDSEYDTMKVSQSGNSKRSVKEAYQRAKKYLARKSKTMKTSNGSENDSDLGDKESSRESSNSES